MSRAAWSLSSGCPELSSCKARRTANGVLGSSDSKVVWPSEEEEEDGDDGEEGE